MKLKIFSSLLLAAMAFVNSYAFAAVTYDDSNDDAGYAQTGDAEVVQGSSARANDIILTFGPAATADIAAAKEIIVRLPDGLNFASAPKYKVEPQTSTLGLTLKDSAGDPTLSTPNVLLSDTNGDGLNDRAVVETATASGLYGNGGDTLTITVYVAADSDATAALKQATVILEGNPGAEVDIAKVIKTAPTLSAADSKLIVIDQTAKNVLAVTTPTIGITLPAGAKNGNTVTLTVNGKLLWNPGTTTVTVVAGSIKAPVTVAPLTGTIIVGASGGSAALATGTNQGTATLTMTVQGAPATGFTDPVPLTLQLNWVTMAAGEAVGTQGVTVGGSAGVSGKANLVSVKANGSSAALNTGAKVTKIVSGGTAAQTLPTIAITQNFQGDLINGTGTVTIKAPTGMKLTTLTSNITITGATNSGGTYTNSVHTYNLTAVSATKVTIAGISATVSVTGPLSVTVGGATIDSQYGPKGDTVQVAEGISVGTVSVAGPKTLTKVGPKSTGKTTAITLKETTYGSLTRAAAKTSTANGVTTTTKAYISITPTNAKITGIARAYSYAKGAPTIAACAAETAPSKTWTCEVTAESSSLVPGTDTITITPTWSSDGVVGDTVSFSIGGNAGVSGSVDGGTVVVTTDATTGTVPQLTIGSTDAQSLSSLTIKQNFAGSTAAGFFRLIAPAGVKFVNPGNISFVGIGTGGSATVTASTFATNDTLVIWSAATPSLTINAEAIISPDVAVGDITVDIVDGNLSAKYLTGMTAESINTGYAVDKITALSGGADISVGANFSATNAITGGVGAKTATSSATGVATVAVDGDSITVTGVAAGAAVITVTDSLGATDAVAVTVTAAEQTAAKAGKALDGSDLPAGTAFSAGASADGGATQATEFTTADTVEIVATVEVGTDIQGEAGAIHVALMTKNGSDTSFSFLNEDGNYETWDISGLPGVHIDAEALAASYNISLYSGELAAGTYRFALAYSSGGNVYYTGKAITLTVTE
jgi:hypothetical protein